MIAQNEINVQRELANKTDNRTVPYKYRTGRILVQIKWWCLYDYSIPDGTGETQLAGLCNHKTKNKIVLFLHYTRHSLNFRSCEKQIFQFLGCSKICNDSKWTKTSRNEVMQPTPSNSNSRTVFPYHVHNQAGFDNPFINRRGIIYLSISKVSFTF